MLKPAAQGCLELIAHAIDHLGRPHDSDRRLALVSFDNAIDTAVTHFIRSPAAKIGRDELRRLELDRRSRTAHVINVLRTKGRSIDSESLGHVTRIRNKTYHDGVGICPDLHTLALAREIAQTIYEGIFESHLEHDLRELSIDAASGYQPGIDQPQLRLLARLDELFGTIKAFVDRADGDDLWLLDEPALSTEWNRLSELNGHRLDDHRDAVISLMHKRKRLLESGIKTQDRRDALGLQNACAFIVDALRNNVFRVEISERIFAAARLKKPPGWESFVLTFLEEQSYDQDDADYEEWGPLIITEFELSPPLTSFSDQYALAGFKDQYDVRLFLERYGLVENLRRLFSTFVRDGETIYSPALAIKKLTEAIDFLNADHVDCLEDRIKAQALLSEMIERLSSELKERLQRMESNDREYVIDNLVDAILKDEALRSNPDLLLRYIEGELRTAERDLLMQAPEAVITRLEEELSKNRDQGESESDGR